MCETTAVPELKNFPLEACIFPLLHADVGIGILNLTPFLNIVGAEVQVIENKELGLS